MNGVFVFVDSGVLVMHACTVLVLIELKRVLQRNDAHLIKNAQTGAGFE